MTVVSLVLRKKFKNTFKPLFFTYSFTKYSTFRENGYSHSNIK